MVVDVTNSPSFEDKAVLEFFETSTRNVLAAEAKTGVGHHVALSIVGSDRLPASGYLRAKVAQEKLIKASPIPYTIVRATQFLSSLGASLMRRPADRPYACPRRCFSQSSRTTSPLTWPKSPWQSR